MSLETVPVPGPNGPKGPPGPVPDPSYHEFRKHLKTGDLLLFRGRDWVSRTIALIENRVEGDGEFTHVGMCVRSESFHYPDPLTKPLWLKEDQVYVFEATIAGFHGACPNVEGRTGLCVQLRNLDDVVHEYFKPEAGIAVSQILEPFRPIGIDQDSLLWQREYERYVGLFYDASLVDLTAVVFPAIRTLRDNVLYRCLRDRIGRLLYGDQRVPSTGPGAGPPAHDNVISHWQFCSQLVSNLYVDLGIFPETIIPKNISPSDLAKLHDKKDIPHVFGPIIRFGSI